MPALWATAKRRADAINHLGEMMTVLSDRYGIAPVVFERPNPHHEPLVQQMLEVEALDVWLSALMPHLATPEAAMEDDSAVALTSAEVNGLEAMTAAQLKDYATAQGIDLGTVSKKADILAAIRAAAPTNVVAEVAATDDSANE